MTTSITIDPLNQARSLNYEFWRVGKFYLFVSAASLVFYQGAGVKLFAPTHLPPMSTFSLRRSELSPGVMKIASWKFSIYAFVVSRYSCVNSRESDTLSNITNEFFEPILRVFFLFVRSKNKILYFQSGEVICMEKFLLTRRQSGPSWFLGHSDRSKTSSRKSVKFRGFFWREEKEKKNESYLERSWGNSSGKLR